MLYQLFDVSRRAATGGFIALMCGLTASMAWQPPALAQARSLAPASLASSGSGCTRSQLRELRALVAPLIEQLAALGAENGTVSHTDMDSLDAGAIDAINAYLANGGTATGCFEDAVAAEMGAFADAGVVPTSVVVPGEDGEEVMYYSSNPASLAEVTFDFGGACNINTGSIGMDELMADSNGDLKGIIEDAQQTKVDVASRSTNLVVLVVVLVVAMVLLWTGTAECWPGPV